ncbi:hypothetical protein SAMN04487768_0253 [Burkholderia sp. b13]|nr:hypothetical protein SAMN04487768_0253 [Burkholderia sp. b13]
MPPRLMAAPDDSQQPQPAPYTHETAPNDTPLVGHLRIDPFLASDALVLLHKKLFAQALGDSSTPIREQRPAHRASTATPYACEPCC